MSYTAAEIANLVKGELAGDGDTVLTGLASADTGREGDLTFAEKEPQFLVAEQGGASAILAPPAFVSSRKVVIHVPNARVAFAKVLPLFHPPETYPPGIDSSARVAASARLPWVNDRRSYNPVGVAAWFTSSPPLMQPRWG